MDGAGLSMMSSVALVVLGLAPFITAQTCGESGGRLRGLLHHSPHGVDAGLWYTAEEVAGRLVGAKVDTLPAGQPFRALRVKHEVKGAGECTAEGEVVDGIAGTPLTCSSGEVATWYKKDAALRGVQGALDRITPAVSALHTTLDDPTIRINDAVARCSIFQSTLFNFHLPLTVGYDLVLFVTFAPLRYPTPTHAAAWPCHFDSTTFRPVVGVINFDPTHLPETSSDDDGYTSTVALHELLHVLGWTPTLAQPRLDVPGSFIDSHFMEQVILPNGRLWLRPRASVVEETDRPTAESWPHGFPQRDAHLPLKRTLVTTPHVVEQARRHYNCTALRGMEVEDHSFPTVLGNRTIPSAYYVHWEKRVASGEVMNSRVEVGSVLSNLSLAMLHDMGYYQVDYSQAQHLSWGFKAGCGFAEGTCMRWGRYEGDAPRYTCLEEYMRWKHAEVPDKPEGCTADYHGLAECSGMTLPGMMPYEYLHRESYRNDRIFHSAEEALTNVGCDEFMDYCMLNNVGPTATKRCSVGQGGFNGRQQDCWKEACNPFSVQAPTAACFLGDLRQVTQGKPYFATGHCLPYRCATSSFGSQVLEVDIGSTTVTCYRKGGLIGPDVEKKDFYTFFPKSSSLLTGKVECPDPALICSGVLPQPPNEPPIFLAPYYKEDGQTAPPGAPESSGPVNVHITRVLINDVQPCVGWSDASGPAVCTLPVWEGSRVVVTIDGGPFVRDVTDGIFVGLGRDAKCEWVGATALAFVGTRLERQRAEFKGVLPHWATAGNTVHLCIQLRLSGVMSFSSLPSLKLQVYQSGLMSVSNDTVVLGDKVYLALWNFTAPRPFVPIYSFVARQRGGEPMLLNAIGSPRISTRMLPLGECVVEGRVHFFDGQRISQWFRRIEHVITVGPASLYSPSEAVLVVDDVLQAVNKVFESSADSIHHGDHELAAEAFRSVTNAVVISDAVMGSSASSRFHTLRQDPLIQIRSTLSVSIEEAVLNLVDDTLRTSVVEEAVRAISEVAYDPSLLPSETLLHLAGAVHSLAESLSLTKGPTGAPRRAVCSSTVARVMGVVEVVHVAKEGMLRELIQKKGQGPDWDNVVRANSRLRAAARAVADTILVDLTLPKSGDDDPVLQQCTEPSALYAHHNAALYVSRTGAGVVTAEGYAVDHHLGSPFVVLVEPQTMYTSCVVNASLCPVSPYLLSARSRDTGSFQVAFAANRTLEKWPSKVQCLCTAAKRDADVCHAVATVLTVRFFVEGQWSVPTALPLLHNASQYCHRLHLGTSPLTPSQTNETVDLSGGTVGIFLAPLSVAVFVPSVQQPGRWERFWHDGWDGGARPMIVTVVTAYSIFFAAMLLLAVLDSRSAPIAKEKLQASTGLVLDSLMNTQPPQQHHLYGLNPLVGLPSGEGHPFLEPGMMAEGRRGDDWVLCKVKRKVAPRSYCVLWENETEEDVHEDMLRPPPTVTLRRPLAGYQALGLEWKGTKLVGVDPTRPAKGIMTHFIGRSVIAVDGEHIPTTVDLSRLLEKARSEVRLLFATESKGPMSMAAFTERIVMERGLEKQRELSGERTIVHPRSAFEVVDDLLRRLMRSLKHHVWLAPWFSIDGVYTRVRRLVLLHSHLTTALLYSTVCYGVLGYTPSTLHLFLTSLVTGCSLWPLLGGMRYALSTPQHTDSYGYLASPQDPWAHTPVHGELSVSVLEARNLPLTLCEKPCDAFALVAFENKCFRGTTKWKSFDPVWEKCPPVTFPVRDPGERLVIEIHTEKEGVVCEAVVDLDELQTFALPPEMGRGIRIREWLTCTVRAKYLGKLTYPVRIPRVLAEITLYLFSSPVPVREVYETPKRLRSPRDHRKATYVAEAMEALRRKEEEDKRDASHHPANQRCDRYSQDTSLPLLKSASKESPTVLTSRDLDTTDEEQHLQVAPKPSNMSRVRHKPRLTSIASGIISVVSIDKSSTVSEERWTPSFHVIPRMAFIACGGVGLYFASPPPLSHFWYLFVACTAVLTLAAPVAPAGPLAAVYFTAVVVWGALYLHVEGLSAVGWVLLIVWFWLLLGFGALASPKAAKAIPYLNVAMAVGVNTAALSPWVSLPALGIGAAVLVAVAVAALWGLRTFFAIPLFVLVAAAQAAVQLFLANEQQALPFALVPAGVLLFGAFFTTLAHRLTNELWLPHEIPAMCGRLALVVAVAVQASCVLAALVLSVDMEGEIGDVYEGVTWFICQDIFLHEPLRHLFALEAVAALRCAARSGLGVLAAGFLHMTGVSQLVELLSPP